MKKNPFGDDVPELRKVNPFADDLVGPDTDADIERVEHAARKIRGLRSQLGAEGLTLSATRELIDELSAALEAAARTMRQLRG